MNIFEHLKDILVTKKVPQIYDTYVPFLVTRWLSMISPPVCNILNETVNRYPCEKEIHYKLLSCILPKQKYMSRIQYIKKLKKEDTDENKNIKTFAQNIEVSEREIKLMLELQKTIR
jgi:hypothetical protein